jgi:hypothetical protein
MKRLASPVAFATALLLLLLALIAAWLFSLQPSAFRWRDPAETRLLAAIAALLIYSLFFGLLHGVVCASGNSSSRTTVTRCW